MRTLQKCYSVWFIPRFKHFVFTVLIPFSKVLIGNSNFFRYFALKNLFTCVGIVIVRRFQKTLTILIYLGLKFLISYSFAFFPQALNQKLSNCRANLASKIVFFCACVRSSDSLIRCQIVLLILNLLVLQIFFAVFLGFIPSLKVSIENRELLEENFTENLLLLLRGSDF